MRTKTTLQQALFTKENSPVFAQHCDTAAWQTVELPHTWNNLDGQDGGSDFYRGACWYKLAVPAPQPGKRQYIELEGANHVAQVYCNGTWLGEHRGGFSTFRFELTEHLQPQGNEVTVCVENGPDNHVYPQQADFTFFGGLYRPVHFLEVEQAHFDLLRKGTSGVFVTPQLQAQAAQVRVDAFTVCAQEGATVCCALQNAEGSTVATVRMPAQPHTVLNLCLEQPHVWHGVEDPYLYTACLTLCKEEEVLDEVQVPFGVRSFSVSPETGFVLNGVSYPLHGVSRHQDRYNKGWAVSQEDHAEDLSLIQEVGANTIRLAHYQHAQHFYDLCDAAGMVLWAEIPFISVQDEHPDAVENTRSQMQELIAQNYNHASICFWGIANEITIAGETESLLENLQMLADLTKQMDPSRLSTMAQVSMLPMDSPHNTLTDVLAYNHYFGWYGGSVEHNGPWMDQFHAKYPNRALGISEYGAEAILQWHTAAPKVKDYTEEYQAYYHEKMLETFAARPYLWATYVWNMFDFAADSRDEGGCQGRNNKGLVTYDRQIKKDSFYAYKAWWSNTPFVHVAGRRFTDRDGSTTCIKVYSSCREVTLVVNGETVGTQAGAHVFVFDNVALRLGENTVVAEAEGALPDAIVLRGVTEPNPAYVLQQEDNSEEVRNWFASIATPETELRFPEGYYSIRDTFGELMKNPITEEIMMTMLGAVMGKSMVKMAKGMMGQMMKGQTMEMLFQFAGDKLPENARVMLNEQLIQVKK